MRRKEFQNILRKYKKGLCTPEEEALVDKWFKSMEMGQDQSFDGSAQNQLKERSWAIVRQHIVDSKGNLVKQSQRSLPTSYKRAWAIAACIGLVAASVGFYTSGPEKHDTQSTPVNAVERTVSNNTDTDMDVHLKDGSRVSLKPNSSITFPEPFADAQRYVALEGEAFFDVSRDTLRPFFVNTRELVTKVLGTSFTISAFLDQENITVAVMSGKVAVMTKKGQVSTNGALNETILTPNQKIIYNRTHNVVSRAIVEKPLPIVESKSVKRKHFEAAPIREIFEGLEQVYGIDIEFDENTFSSCILTTSIGEGNIYNRLDMICKAIDAHYVITENHIVISGSGCSR
jgi:ferric-dicitrate binding protein FerR (iron transport regulator)